MTKEDLFLEETEEDLFFEETAIPLMLIKSRINQHQRKTATGKIHKEDLKHTPLS